MHNWHDQEDDLWGSHWLCFLADLFHYINPKQNVFQVIEYFAAISEVISSGPIPTEDNVRVHVAEEIHNRLTGVAREKRRGV